ncbi:hypothetical protein Tco_1263273 [Tanacetum coccineum]
MRKVNTFVLIESEVNRAVSELAAGSSKMAAKEELDQESSKRQNTGESSELAEETRDKEADELSQEELQQMMIIVSEKYWKIIRVGNHTKVHHFFDDMLKAFNMDNLVMLWSLVKEKFNSTEPTDDKEREIWVDASCVYKEGNIHLHAGREGVSIVKRNSYIDNWSQRSWWIKIMRCPENFLGRYSCRVNIKFRGGLLGLKGFLVLLKLMLLVMIITAAGYVSTAGEDCWNTLSYYCC